MCQFVEGCCGANTCWQDAHQDSQLEVSESVCCQGSAVAVKRACSGIPLNAGGPGPNNNACGAVGPLGCSVCKR